MFRNPASSDKSGFGDKPSSSDLGKLLLCEVEYVHERRTGVGRTDSATKQRSNEGQAEHLKAQVAMETFHNRRRSTDSESATDSGTRVASTRDKRCFVASAVYGPAAPETDELRSYRDRVLSTSVLGRALIGMYYLVSPPVAQWLATKPAASRFVRLALDRVRLTIRARTR